MSEFVVPGDHRGDDVNREGAVAPPRTGPKLKQGRENPDDGTGDSKARKSPNHRRRLIRGLKVLLVLIASWLMAAYVILPALWYHYENCPCMETAPKTTITPEGIPGDPLNVGLIGGEKELVHATLRSGWSPADPVTIGTSVGIALSVLLGVCLFITL